MLDEPPPAWYNEIIKGQTKPKRKEKIKMKKILAILRAMLADETPYIPDVYNVQAFGANGLF